ncbi:MAG: hypothetical protein IT552_12365 [Sphingomonadaceae bacterium]|nr:hypothetical protein [Sphingomonadaceae bacterium]
MMGLQSAAFTTGSAVATLALSMMVGYGGSTFVKDVTAPPPPRAIVPVSLHWDADRREIGQLLRVEGAPINASWGASFWRAGRKLCGSGGRAEYPPRDGVYPGDVKWLTPDRWTGSTCPPLQPGDVASANWEWLTETGAIRSASIEFKLPK